MKINGQKIQMLQAALGLSQGRLAETSGVSRQALSTLLSRGTCRPETAGKIARALGVDPEEIAAPKAE